MSKSVYVPGCIREIRKADYGRDVRKPIADAIECLRDELQGNYVTGISTELISGDNYRINIVRESPE